MHDLLHTIDLWRARGNAVALATIVGTGGSAPRPLGARMAVSSDGQIAGSVSGGCVEGAVVEIAMQVMEDGQPQLVHFGISDQAAWDVGLMCGGEIDVFVEKLDARFDEIVARMRASQTFRLDTAIRGAGIGQKTLSDPSAPAPAPSPDVFSELIAPPPALYIAGASHIAIALVTIAQMLGYRVTVIDPRQAFATPARFAHADALWIDYPQNVLKPEMLNSNSCVAVLTHDPKVDDPALLVAVKSNARYIGALGSRRTHANRVERLKKAGVTDEQLARIHAPIGLPIGARTPEEIAVAVAAEMVAAVRIQSTAHRAQN
jgi:xanthine dehydrogenase accessory factor